MIPSRFGRLLGAVLLLAPSLALGQSMIQQPNTGVSGSKAEPLPHALIKLYQNDVGLDSRLSTVEGTLNRVVGTVGSFGTAASKNVGVTVGTVADGGALTAETNRALAAEGANAAAISGEVSRATAAEAALQAAIGAATNAYAVNYTAQSLTSAQQLQARQNISAAASGDTLVLGNGSTTTTQSAGDSTTKVATTAFSTGALSSFASTVASTYAPLASPTFTGSPKAPTPVTGDNSTALATTAFVQASAAPTGQVQLVYSSSTAVVLIPLNGNRLFIAGKLYAVPAGGVTLANTGLGAATRYYVYAFMNGATMTLEAVSTAPAVDATYGHKIKSGDGSRTLVGMVHMAGASGTGTFSDTVTFRGVFSYFNRRTIVLRQAVNGSTNSGAYTGISGTVIFLCWGDEAATVSVVGTFSNSTAGTPSAINVLDAVQYGQASGGGIDGAGGSLPVNAVGEAASGEMSEGTHSLSAAGNTNSGTATWSATQFVRTRG